MAHWSNGVLIRESGKYKMNFLAFQGKHGRKSFDFVFCHRLFVLFIFCLSSLHLLAGQKNSCLIKKFAKTQPHCTLECVTLKIIFFMRRQILFIHLEKQIRTRLFKLGVLFRASCLLFVYFLL